MLLLQLTETDYSQQLLVKDPNKISRNSVQWKLNPSMRTDRYDEANNRFPHLFYESIYVQIPLSTVSFNSSYIRGNFVL